MSERSAPVTVEAAAAGRRAYRLILLGTFVSTVGSGLTLPFLIIYLHDVLGASLPVAGVVLAISAAAELAASTAGGPIGDRIGLGRLMVTGLTAQAAGSALLALEAGLGVATLGVILIGVGFGSVLPAVNALIALQIPPQGRSRAFSLQFGMLNAGVGVGGLISGFIVSVEHPGSFQIIYSADASCTLAFALLAGVGLRGARGFRPSPAPVAREAGLRGYRAVLADRPFTAYLLLALAIGVFGYAQLNGPWAAFATGAGGSSTRVVGLAFAANTAVIVALQLPIERVTRGLRRSRMLVATCLIWAAAWALSGAASLPALRGAAADVGFIASLCVFGLGETFLSPVGGVVANALAPDALRGRYNALAGATMPFGQLIGPPLAGLVLAGPEPRLWSVAITVGALACAVGALGVGRLLPREVDVPAG